MGKNWSLSPKILGPKWIPNLMTFRTYNLTQRIFLKIQLWFFSPNRPGAWWVWFGNYVGDSEVWFRPWCRPLELWIFFRLNCTCYNSCRPDGPISANFYQAERLFCEVFCNNELHRSEIFVRTKVVTFQPSSVGAILDNFNHNIQKVFLIKINVEFLQQTVSYSSERLIFEWRFFLIQDVFDHCNPIEIQNS